MTWVWRDGALVIKTAELASGRSALPCPNVIRDGLAEPLQHQANGMWYDSKRAMEKADREAGVVCIGNEAPKLAARADPPPFDKADVIEAYEKVRQGYKPQSHIESDAPLETGWT